MDKQIGERTHKFRLDDAEFLNEDMSPDNLILKRSIEGFIEKLDVVSQAILKVMKQNKQIVPRLNKLEESQSNYLSLLDFRQEMQVATQQMQSEISDSLNQYHSKLDSVDADLQKYKLDSETHIKNFTSEVLWRIRDAEELLKQRVSETRV